MFVNGEAFPAHYWPHAEWPQAPPQKLLYGWRQHQCGRRDASPCAFMALGSDRPPCRSIASDRDPGSSPGGTGILPVQESARLEACPHQERPWTPALSRRSDDNSKIPLYPPLVKGEAKGDLSRHPYPTLRGTFGRVDVAASHRRARCSAQSWRYEFLPEGRLAGPIRLFAKSGFPRILSAPPLSPSALSAF